MKYIITVIVLFLLCNSSGCFAVKEQGVKDIVTEKTEVKNLQVTDSVGFEPFCIKKSEKGYVYQIYNDNALVEEGETRKEPTVQHVTDSVIYVAEQTGTGKSTNWGFFYDYSSNMRSDTFTWVLDYTETIVIIGNKDKLILRHIFDDTYYFEFTNFNQPLARIADSILDAVFLDDGVTIAVTYVTEGSRDIATQIFSLEG